MSRRSGTLAEAAAIGLLDTARVLNTRIERTESVVPGINAWRADGRACRTSHPDAVKMTLAGLLARALYECRDTFSPHTAQRGYELAADAVLQVGEASDLHELNNKRPDRPDIERLLIAAGELVRANPEAINDRGGTRGVQSQGAR